MRSSTLLPVVLTLLSATAAAEPTLGGTSLRIHYGDDGLWHDTVANQGLQVSEDGLDFVDVTAPGSDGAGLVLEWTIAGVPRSMALNSHSVDVGDVNVVIAEDRSTTELAIAYHVYDVGTPASLRLHKWELLDRTGQTLTVYYEVHNIGRQRISDLVLQHGTDIDLDDDGLDNPTIDDAEDTDLDGRADWATSSNLTGWTVGLGACDGANGIVGHTGDAPSVPGAAIIDPDGETADRALLWREDLGALPAASSTSTTMVLGFATTVEAARDLWLAEGLTACTLPDVDQDGVPREDVGGADCDDTSSSVQPTASELPGNGIDEDCDDLDALVCYTDADGDGWGGAAARPLPAGQDCDPDTESPLRGDCDDTDATVRPGTFDLPNDGVDNDCDGGDDWVDNDTDLDGLADGTETALGTNPAVADTDGDGLDDGVEQLMVGTNPTLADTDSDGLDDADELFATGPLFGGEPTDPTRTDSDGDGLNDGLEVLGTGALEPWGPSDPNNIDSDGDGLNDGDEVNGTGPLADATPTNPNSADTDGDTIHDDVELTNGTNPAKADSDDDGLDDADEARLGTDPLLADTDGDGIIDFEEQTDADGDGVIDALQATKTRYIPTGTTCNSGGAPASGMFLLLLAGLVRRRRSIVAAAAIANTAAAQEDNNVQLNLQMFEPSGISSGFASVHSARLLPQGRVGVEVTGNWAYQPMQKSVVIGTDVMAEEPAVEHLTAVHLRAAVGATSWFQIAVHSPIVQFATTGTGFSQFGGNSDRGVGFGDVTFDLAFAPLAEKRGAGLVLAPFVTAPSGTPDLFLTHGVPTTGARLAVSGTAGPVALSTFLTYRLKVGGTQMGLDPNDADAPGAVAIDDLLHYGAGIGFEMVPEVRFNIETNGNSTVGPETGRILKQAATPGLHTAVEVGGNFMFRSRDGYSMVIGGTAGMTPAVGTPTARAFLTIGYAPQTVADRDRDGLHNGIDDCPDEPEDMDKFEDEDGCPEYDNDRDGHRDEVDDCPNDPEDDDGFRDDDGCPDRDNDRDRIPDEIDDCPDIPEDKDRFQDRDGCPDVDNDNDTILDEADACPEIPEDFDGFHDEDGCPEEELDRDADGLIDERDPCPDVAEDVDGFEDDDGCPDLDNDQDGKDDLVDLCPMEPENYNDYLDEDGCPDETKAVLQEDRIVILDKVLFFVGEDRIRPESFPILDAVYSTLVANPQVERLRVEGHTDSDGSDAFNQDLSERRALSVRQYLIDRGISPQRLYARGYGELYPIASNRTPEGKEQNRRVEFIVLDDDEPTETQAE